MSANKTPINSSRFNSTGATISIPVTLPQANDEEPELLAKIALLLSGGVSPPDPSSPAGGTAQITTLNATGAGTLAAGAMFARFQNVGAGNATVGGVTVLPGGVLLYPTDYGILLPAISYDGTGTNLLISATSPPA